MDVVAFRRRDRIVLAALLEPAAEGTSRLRVVTEDCRELNLDRRGVLAHLRGPDGATDDPARVAELLTTWRASAGEPPEWERVHRSLPEETVLSFAEIAAAAGEPGAEASLDWVLGLATCEPWLRRVAPDARGEGGGFRVVARAAAEAAFHRDEAKRRRKAENEALLAWWRKEGVPFPDAAAGARDALAAFALAAPGAAAHDPAVERGRLLAAKLDMPEPDQALEACVDRGFIADGVDPSLARAGLDAPFDEAALAATRVDPPSIERVDLRDLDTVAIDDAETIEVDDALSLRTVDGRRELLVHIADVAAHVPAGGALDRAIRERAATLYTPDRIHTLMPRTFVHERLSLDVGADRDALTVVFPIGDDGLPGTPTFRRSRVRVDRALGYAEADDARTLGGGDESVGRFLLDLGTRLRERRNADGAISFTLDSLKISLEDGSVRVRHRGQGSPSDRLVAECMILTNAAVGRLLADAGRPAVFRTQDPPRGPLPAEGTPLRDVLGRRLLSPARTSVEPKPHAGLGLTAYAQSTSPIRRYGDLVNQRLLLDALADRATSMTADELKSLVKHLARRERDVRAASHAREAYWLATSLLPRKGTRVRGRLARAPRKGLGSVLVPEFARELPLRAPKGWHAPDVGTEREWTLAVIRPYRARIELAP